MTRRSLSLSPFTQIDTLHEWTNESKIGLSFQALFAMEMVFIFLHGFFSLEFVSNLLQYLDKRDKSIRSWRTEGVCWRPKPHRQTPPSWRWCTNVRSWPPSRPQQHCNNLKHPKILESLTIFLNDWMRGYSEKFCPEFCPHFTLSHQKSKIMKTKNLLATRKIVTLWFFLATQCSVGQMSWAMALQCDNDNDNDNYKNEVVCICPLCNELLPPVFDKLWPVATLQEPSFSHAQPNDPPSKMSFWMFEVFVSVVRIYITFIIFAYISLHHFYIFITLQSDWCCSNALRNTIAGSPDAVWRFLTGLATRLAPQVANDVPRPLRDVFPAEPSQVS